MSQASVVIVGGGVIGAATACFLARDHGRAVRVLERDPSYRQASSALSASSIRQQFSTPINIALSQASIEFLRRVGDELEVQGDRPAIGLVEDPSKGTSGPLWVKGGIPIEAADGFEYAKRNRVTLCRCGRSHKKPFCDGSHAAAGFKAKP